MYRRPIWLTWLLLVCCTGPAALAQDDQPARGEISPEALAAARARLASGTLKWGGDAEGGAPYQFHDDRDISRVVGFEVDLADALANAAARRIDRPLRAEFVQYEWVSLSQGLTRGDFDVILSGYEITPERMRAMRFSRPYYLYAQQLVVRADEERIASLADCRDKRVGTLSGSAADRLLQERGIEASGYQGQVEPYLELQLDRLDAVLLDTAIVTYYADTNSKLKRVGPEIGQGAYGIALRPEDAALATILDAALSDLMRDGTLKTILRRWHLWNADQPRLARGEREQEERLGLAFDPLEPAPPDAVERNVIAASADRWTVARYGPVLLAAAGMTVFLTACSMALAMAWGLAIALSRLFAPAPVRLAALAYVEFFRGIPVLLVLFVLYYGLASAGLQLEGWMAAILGFGMNYAAYEAEIYRSAILSVPGRQWEAARALGMSESQAFRRVIFPQALRTALGPMTNDFVALFKDTSVVSVIAVVDLTKQYMILSRSSLKFVEMGLLTAALYLAMSIPLGALSRRLEAKTGANQA